ncbi:MAG: hypothetical protein JRC59_09255 [Deltaproteobacteria bacterium]|nr:hypothetical protein [Deltaproteobacteria bacterium]
MRLYKNKWFWITGTFAFLAFLLLFMIRLDLFEKFFNRPQSLEISSLFMIRLDLFEKFFNRPQSLEIYSISSPHEKETWMNIFQNNRKIGFSHTKISPDSEGYRLQKTVLMRINTMGLVQDIQLKTRGRLKADYSLSAFDF